MRLNTDIKMNDDELKNKARELALFRVVRGKKADIEGINVQTIKKEVGIAYNRMCIGAKSDDVCPGAMHTLMENHYIVDKALSALSDAGKEIAHRRYTVFENGRYKGCMRVHILVSILLGGKNFSLDHASLSMFLNAFQEIAPLDESEIALLPDMLKTVCLERAHTCYKDISELLREYVKAKRIYKKICEAQTLQRTGLLFDAAFSELSETGILRLYMILSDNDEFAYIDMLKKRAEINGISISDEAGSNSTYQSFLSELIVNIASTLRFADGLQTDSLLEEFSMLGKILEKDETYKLMDIPSKRAYADSCAKIAGKLKITQAAVANAAQKLSGDRGMGYYLIKDEGRAELIRYLGGRANMISKKSKLCAFISIQLFIATVISCFCLSEGILSALFVFLPALTIANAITLRAFCNAKRPMPVPRIKLGKTSPEKTIVAVSQLVTDEKSLNEGIERLETHYFSGNMENTYYAILGDFKDSKSESVTDEEAALLETAKKRIAELNKKYAHGEDIFYFLHRNKKFNEQDGIYMGHERKRGAIMDFFGILTADDRRGHLAEYSLITSELPHGIRYALLLDSDTVMPKGSLQSMIGAALHPENRPHIEDGKIVSGYGIFIPRMERLPGETTEFMRSRSTASGITPYSNAVCDFYHDNFSESIFGGKGLVDIRVFSECIKDRIDDNTVLSHDMLESCFVKAAYLSDVILYDSEPDKLFAWWKREHRWIRGDWQILPYLFAKKYGKKHLSALSKWKIADNLRRSITPVAIVLCLLLVPFMGFGLYAFIAIAAAFSDCIISTVSGLFGLLRGGKFPVSAQCNIWTRGFIDFMSLPYAAWQTQDAIVRTLYRLIFSHKNMLQWQTAAQSGGKKQKSLMGYYMGLWQCVLLGLFLMLTPLFALHGSVILGVLFLYAPFGLYLADAEFKKESLSQPEREYFMGLARDIWAFFVSETDEQMGYIPPDNVQLYPEMPSVKNASPTNIGMGIMAAVCAYYLGFIDDDELVRRQEITLKKIKSFDRRNGHLYNWYDIVSGKRLEPAYVSTVDSGNFCASLLCAAQVLYEIGTDRANKCADDMRKMVYETDFSALYDEDKSLFYIGYDVTRCSLTRAWYDLLASEARLTYLVACALDAVPQKSWLALGRLLTKTGSGRALISWSGTMFEYLMPVIFTGTVRDTLMDETVKAVIDEHISCAGEKPWGISESGYYAFDRNMYYQYRAFGARALGIAPMKANDAVMAPYASILAAMVYPKKAYSNLLCLERIGARSKYGFFEAVDYTDGRVEKGHECEIVQSFMAHHQGMSICALCNALTDGAIARAFSKVPEMRTVMLYNAESLPDSALTLKKYERPVMPDSDDRKKHYKAESYESRGRYPGGTFLTNGRMTAFLTDSGISYIKLGDRYVTRFRRDGLRGKYGLKLYLRSEDKVYCINTYDSYADECKMRFTYDQYRAQTDMSADGISVKTETVMLQNEDALCIKVSIANTSDLDKNMELGAFCEMSLAKPADDIAHPAFVRLTVDAMQKDDMLIFRRRGTKKREDMYVCAGIFNAGSTKMCADGIVSPGRHGNYAEAMKTPMYTDMRIKSPCEPLLCMRNEFRTDSGSSREIYFIIGASNSMENAVSGVKNGYEADFYAKSSLAFAMDMSALHFMNISEGKAHLFTTIMTRLFLGIKSKPKIIRKSSLQVTDLYKYSVSGDLPIMLVEISTPTQFRLLKTLLLLLKFSAYKGELFDLIIIGRYEASYRCDIKAYIEELMASFMLSVTAEEKAHIHLIDGYSLSDDEYLLLIQSADIVIDPERTLGSQFADETARLSSCNVTAPERLPSSQGILCGEFAANGEYVMKISSDMNTPMPWSNIICNPQNERMGTLITESGGGYTWYGNCHSTRLSDWYCDALHDTQGEILLISDDKGHVRSVFHSGIQGNSAVEIRHGFGYSSVKNDDALCNACLTIMTDTTAPQKLSLLELTNHSDKEIRLTLKYMLDKKSIKGAYTEFYNGCACIYGTEMKECIYTGIKNADSVQFSSDREGELCLFDVKENKNTDGFTCLTCDVVLHPEQKRELVLILGVGLKENIGQYTYGITAGGAHERLAKIKSAWDKKLGGITVHTPDKNFDCMVNGRLLYQVYAARLMGRTGFYQSGGAIGFRDQLQDVLALLYTDPERAKGQILLCASMQYEKGDVMHWWHEKAKGVRTKISDDRLFLPFACAEYASVTGDMDIFSLRIPYLEDKEIPQGQDDVYYSAKHSERDGTLYEHCMKAIECTCKFGAHDLPCMGTGDWNDGMDNVGENGGESVFLAFFLIVTIEKFMHICTKRNDAAGYKFLKSTVRSLRKAVSAYAWDGEWFRRAYYADGTPLGSKENDECMIDLLSQAWGVFSERKHDRDKCERAMRSCRELLRDDKGKLIKLLTPAFSDSKEKHNAGYIESYAEGVRENGGQYTHAAMWYLIALCVLDKDDEAMEVWHMLNPAEKDIWHYMTEPYAVAADVYSVEGASGRGGWTWYTGSAAWCYIAAVKYILGIVKKGNILRFHPHNTWHEYDVTYRYASATYKIHIERAKMSSITIDREQVEELVLKDDGKLHECVVCVGDEKIG